MKSRQKMSRLSRAFEGSSDSLHASTRKPSSGNVTTLSVLPREKVSPESTAIQECLLRNFLLPSVSEDEWSQC